MAALVLLSVSLPCLLVKCSQNIFTFQSIFPSFVLFFIISLSLIFITFVLPILIFVFSSFVLLPILISIRRYLINLMSCKRFEKIRVGSPRRWKLVKPEQAAFRLVLVRMFLALFSVD